MDQETETSDSYVQIYHDEPIEFKFKAQEIYNGPLKVQSPKNGPIKLNQKPNNEFSLTFHLHFANLCIYYMHISSINKSCTFSSSLHTLTVMEWRISTTTTTTIVLAIMMNLPTTQKKSGSLLCVMFVRFLLQFPFFVFLFLFLFLCFLSYEFKLWREQPIMEVFLIFTIISLSFSTSLRLILFNINISMFVLKIREQC